MVQQVSISPFKSEFDVLDIRMPGPGRNKQPDAAWVPSHRPLDAAFDPLMPRQTNGDPSLVLEVGNSLSISDIIAIRDRMLSWRTAVNVFVLIAYNRDATINKATDSWFLQIAVRDYFAPEPPTGTGIHYPSCIVLYETPKIGRRYTRVDSPLAEGNQVHHLDTRHLYHPEPPPILDPPLPASFRIDAEQIRMTIIRRRS